MVTRMVPQGQLHGPIRREIVDLGNDTLVVTQRGRPRAVLVSVSRWNDLQEHVQELEDAVAILDARTSKGRARPADEVFEEIEYDADVQPQ